MRLTAFIWFFHCGGIDWFRRDVVRRRHVVMLVLSPERYGGDDWQTIEKMSEKVV